MDFSNSGSMAFPVFYPRQQGALDGTGLFFFTSISDTDLIGNNLIVLITTNRFIQIFSLRKGKNPLH